MTATPLDVLLTRGLISEDQHAAGQVFARTRWALYGPAWARACDLGLPVTSAGEIPEATLRRLQAEYEAFWAALASLNRQIADRIVNVAVCLRAPRILLVDDARAERELRQIRAGLGALVSVKTARHA